MLTDNYQKSGTNQTRTRFAPSPTGFMHVGGARTALFAWLIARKNGGQFVLRIEDTDKQREVKGSEQHIIDSLSWLGLMWDEGPDKGGGAAPYRQSQRLEIYKQWAQKLVDGGRAYPDPYDEAHIQELRNKAKAEKRPFLFRDYRPDELAAWDGKQPLRFKSEPKSYQWHDEVMGYMSAGAEAVDDFIILKADGYPTYNFAHIIDDHLMKITHVIRSQEFLASVPKFLNLYEALKIACPKLATLPYVLGPDGHKKLSKRDGAKDLMDYKKQGFLPEAIINFLATIGWNDGTEQEVFSTEELITKFDLSRVQKSGARFDEQRLVWMNGAHIRSLNTEELYEKIELTNIDFWGEGSNADKDYKLRVLEVVKERLKYFAELSDLTTFFFSRPQLSVIKGMLDQPPDKQLAKTDASNFGPMLKAVKETLDESDFSQEDVQVRLNALLEKLDTKPGILFALIRIAISGQKFSPEISATLHVLGKEETLARLNDAITTLEK